MNLKYLTIGGALISLIGLSAGFPTFYRVYLSEGTKAALKQMDYNSAINAYGYCKIHNFSIVQVPHEECLEFFRVYVPKQFKNSTPSEFPIAFTNKEDFVKTYNFVQKDLKELGKEELPSLLVLTHAQ